MNFYKWPLFCAAESDDQISEPAPAPQYTEVNIGEADPNRGEFIYLRALL